MSPKDSRVGPSLGREDSWGMPEGSFGGVCHSWGYSFGSHTPSDVKL